MIKTKKLFRKLYKFFPRDLAKKNHDYVGVMVSTKKENIQKIVLCLDLDDTVMKESVSFNPDLFISHHPFIYGRSKVNVLKHDVLRKSWVEELTKNNQGVFSIHTNFDEASGGMNDVLSSLLELKNIYINEKCPMMRIGYLENPLPIDDFVLYAKEKLNVNYALLTGYGNNIIKKVAIIGGGGAGYYMAAKDENADIYISGDAPHHVRRGIAINKFNYLEVPHEVERVFMKRMKDILLSIDPNLEILIVDHEKELKVY